MRKRVVVKLCGKKLFVFKDIYREEEKKKSVTISSLFIV